MNKIYVSLNQARRIWFDNYSIKHFEKLFKNTNLYTTEFFKIYEPLNYKKSNIYKPSKINYKNNNK